MFLARTRNKSCAEPLRRSMTAQRFSRTATRHKTKKHPVCRWPYFVSRSCSKQKLRRTASPPYHGSAFLAYGHAAQDKKAPCLPVAVLCFSLVLETKAAPNRFAALSRLSVSRIRPRGMQKNRPRLAGSVFLVPVAGLEPARYRYRWILSPLRLPIPSHRRVMLFYNTIYQFVWQAF